MKKNMQILAAIVLMGTATCYPGWRDWFTKGPNTRNYDVVPTSLSSTPRDYDVVPEGVSTGYSRTSWPTTRPTDSENNKAPQPSGMQTQYRTSLPTIRPTDSWVTRLVNFFTPKPDLSKYEKLPVTYHEGLPHTRVTIPPLTPKKHRRVKKIGNQYYIKITPSNKTIDGSSNNKIINWRLEGDELGVNWISGFPNRGYVIPSKEGGILFKSVPKTSKMFNEKTEKAFEEQRNITE